MTLNEIFLDPVPQVYIICHDRETRLDDDPYRMWYH